MHANNHDVVPQDSMEPLTQGREIPEEQEARVEHNLGHIFAGLGIVGVVLFIVFGIAQIYAGYIGIAHHLGGLWAALAIGAAVIFRFTLPITIGSFFGAMSVWGWPWIGAALFAAPGLLFVIPGALASILSMVKR
jgi:regulator of protease activity HflC (stomatin/prohibitin superfamily)